MSRLCIEDGMEYNIKNAMEEYFDLYDDPQEAMDDFNGGDNDDFVNQLYEACSQYTDLEKVAKDELEKRSSD